MTRLRGGASMHYALCARSQCAVRRCELSINASMDPRLARGYPALRFIRMTALRHQVGELRAREAPRGRATRLATGPYGGSRPASRGHEERAAGAGAALGQGGSGYPVCVCVCVCVCVHVQMYVYVYDLSVDRSIVPSDNLSLLCLSLNCMHSIHVVLSFIF